MKKIILVVLITCISTIAFAADMGDANEDGVANIVDALAVAQHYIGITTIRINRNLADVDCNGRVMITDSLFIAQYYVGIISRFPCNKYTPTPTPTTTPPPTPTPTATPEPTATPTPAPAGFAVSPRTISVDDDEKFTTEINLEAPGYRVSSFNIYINYDSQLIIPDPAAGIQMVGMTFGDYYISRGGNFINIDYSNVIQGRASGTLMTIHWLSLSDVDGSCDIEIKVNRIDDMDGNDLQSTTTNGRCTVSRTNYVGMRWDNQSNNQVITGASSVASYVYFDTGRQEATDFEFTITYNPNHLALDETVGEMGVEILSSGVDINVHRVHTTAISVAGDNFSGISSGNVLKINWKTRPSVSGSGTISVSSINLWDSGSTMAAQGVSASYTLQSATATPVVTETPDPTPTPTPVIKPANFKVDLELPSPARWGGTITHWIPNNREPMEPFRIKASANNNMGDGTIIGNFHFTNDYQYIYILTPTDAAFNSSETGNSNIHMNRGTAPIEIYACNAHGGNTELIASYELNQAITASAARYTQTANNTALNLRVASDGYLYFDTGFDELQYFTVQLGDGGTARPGDDIQLRFELLNYPQHSDTVSDGDFLAVYDKAILDRANMYIDQRIDEDGDATGTADWNTNQIDIEEWRNFDTGTLVHNAVAYGWSCEDTVAEFNAGMETQNAVTRWIDYQMPVFEIVESGGVKYYKPVDGNTRVVPGLSTYARFRTADSKLIYKDADGKALDADGGILDDGNYVEKTDGTHVPHNWSGRIDSATAGLDCSGFLYQSAHYTGSPYVCANIRLATGGYASDDYSWAVDRNMLVPGDILVYPNSHVVIVARVGFAENSRVLQVNDNGTSNNVNVIESGSGTNGEWRVMNTNRWVDIGNSYELRRLIINN